MSRILVTDTFPGLPGADLVQYPAITRAVLAALPTGALVGRYEIGVDNVDTAAAAEEMTTGRFGDDGYFRLRSS